MISEHDRQVLSRLPAWNPSGDVVAQRRAWEELATVYNHDLPAIGDLEQNVELRAGLPADVAVPKGAGRHPVVIYLHGGGWAFGPRASVPGSTGRLDVRHWMGGGQRAPMERRWPADRDRRRFRGRQPGGQRHHLERS